ncbi:xanthine dehydrogenase small subunit [Oryzisolibacter propanilivorax]|uniref:Xanthine dehydrogenase small subunit n=1 Tax=Oryzisolibacter propanilivorax TaxID=1527607 RepID=A0A1G9UUT9_9BURK|nr:xanthine dehydrogenase small subunit [Oryzisolibacter propanilivorax]SDM63673.1 xanthine dehydrogenase small subunit [Oryzisolibacter propanilivorax]
MSTQPIRFFHRGAVVEVHDVHPTRSVLDWLREDAHCTGTKEGCNEGDCGACTVVIGELPEHTDAPESAVRGLSLRTVNACIQFLPTLHGKALFTVEDIKQLALDADPAPAQEMPAVAALAKPATQLHPVQQAMVDCHGSQCGFCTPGFVMSLWSTYEKHGACGTQPSRQQLADDLSGNLCRCTGYRPILDAGQRMFDLPQVQLNTAPVVAALQALREDEQTFTYAGLNPRLRSDRFFAPRTLQALATLRAEHPQARMLAGSTDVGLWVNKMFRDLGDILFVGDVDELKVVREQDGAQGRELYIGAGASLTSAWTALVQRWPALEDVWLRFASLPIRNAGTMGGNVANGSPIGDSPPILMGLDAQIELRKADRVRRMPLEDFYIDYMKNHLEAGEFVQGLSIPLSMLSHQVRGYKISKRFDCDISALCAGFSIAVEGDVVRDVRLAYGGMAATVRRAKHAESALLGKPWTHDNVSAAKAALVQDYQPLTDMRASADYRLQVAQNLLQRFWLETRTEHPLPSEETSVFSVMPHVTAATAPAGVRTANSLTQGA